MHTYILVFFSLFCIDIFTHAMQHDHRDCPTRQFIATTRYSEKYGEYIIKQNPAVTTYLEDSFNWNGSIIVPCKKYPRGRKVFTEEGMYILPVYCVVPKNSSLLIRREQLYEDRGSYFFYIKESLS
jgi:hypothetical protein